MSRLASLPALTCGGCRHWHQMPPDPLAIGAPPQGQCRQGRPAAVFTIHPQLGPGTNWTYPTLPENYPACGQFARRREILANGTTEEPSHEPT